MLKLLDLEDQMVEEYLIDDQDMMDAEDQMVEEHLIDGQNITEEQTSEMCVKERDYALEIEPVDLFQDFEEKLNAPQSPYEIVQIKESYVEDRRDTPEACNKQKGMLAEFLESPETPKRTGTLRFKAKTEEKKKEEEEKQRKAEKKEEKEKQRKADPRKNKKKPPRKP